MLVTGGMTLLGPHGYAQGRTVFLGDPHMGHLYHRNWDRALELHTRLCVVYVCVMAYVATVVARSTSARVVAWAKLLRAVVTLTAPFLIIYGLQTTRLAELSSADHTGWALWCLVPFTYVAIL